MSREGSANRQLRRAYRSPIATDTLVARLRQEFLARLIVQRKRIVSDLRRLLRQYEAARPALRFEDETGRSLYGRLGWFAAAFSYAPQTQTLRQGLLDWAGRHSLEYDWVLDTALNTLELWSSGASQAPLTVPATDAQNRAEVEPVFTFRPTVRLANVGYSLPKYRLEIISQFEKALSDHLDEIPPATYAIPDNLARELEWTVERFTGTAVKTIVTRATVPVSRRAVTAAIRRMVLRIGLERAVPRGRPRKNRR